MNNWVQNFFLVSEKDLKEELFLAISHKLPFYKSFLVARGVKRLERYAQIFIQRLLKVENGRTREELSLYRQRSKKEMLRVRLYLFVCPAKPSWSLATV